VHHALGLLLVRSGRLTDAVEELAKATQTAPDSARFSYVYAIALSSAGRREEALRVLEQNHLRHPGDRETLVALVTMNREAGSRDAALRYAKKLEELVPGDPGVARMLQELETSAR
jgi:Flp pilus assembly protein TadD